MKAGLLISSSSSAGSVVSRHICLKQALSTAKRGQEPKFYTHFCQGLVLVVLIPEKQVVP